MFLSRKDLNATFEWDDKDIYHKDGVKLISEILNMLYKKDKLHEINECK